jgi:hypothetical protein
VRLLARPRIPVTAGSIVIEMAGPERVRKLLLAPNAAPVYTRRRAIGAIEILACGDDSAVRPRTGNPQKFAIRAETDENPKNVWTLKRLSPVAS